MMNDGVIIVVRVSLTNQKWHGHFLALAGQTRSSAVSDGTHSLVFCSFPQIRYCLLIS